MKTTHRVVAGVSLMACVAALAAAPAWTQGQSGTVARYTIDAGTLSGMAAMAANSGGGMGIGSALGALRGNQVAHELQLRLGSTRAATGEPKADHFLPSGTRLGASVSLLTPRPAAPTPRGEGVPPGQVQMPQGRLLLFWGCGEKAGAGQPVVIDFSKLARGQVPPGLYAQIANLPESWSVNQGNSRTFGEWPNERDSKRVPANASLLGAHRIASTYAPEIAFNLADDFMPALQPTTRDMPSGAVGLNWNGLPTATGYYAWVIATGGANSGDMVWWASSAKQAFGGPMAEWLSPAAVARLVADKTVMPPSQTSCAIPAEVKSAGGPIMMTNLYAYGPQADFSFPARPANAARNWSPEWIARVRFRANAMVMHGMPGMGAPEAEERGSQAPAQGGLPRCRGGLRGIAERAAGLCQ